MYNFLKRALDSNFRNSQYSVFALGIIGSLGHPLYWIWWTFIDPRYENATLRIIGTVSCMILFTYKYWKKPFLDFFPLYWFLTVTYNFPFLFTTYLIKNNFSLMWSMAEVAVVFFLTVLFRKIVFFFTSMITGVSLAIFYCSLTYDGTYQIYPNFSLLIFDYLPAFFFIISSGLMLNYSGVLSIIKNQREKMAKSLAGSIAHELRNPLNVVNLATTQISEIASKISDEKFRKEIEMIDQTIINSVNQANETINIILSDISEKPITDDQFSLIKTENIIPQIIDSFGYKSFEEKSRVKFVDDGNNFIFRAVIERFTFIIYNLLKNALYYLKEYPDSVIVIGCEQKKFHGKNWNVIYVYDTGPGVPPEVMPKLFGDFYTSGKKGGTGLGLTFCKRNMQIFGGDVICESEYKGQKDKASWTKFSLLFPIISIKKINKASMQDKRKKILLVDDQQTNLLATKSRIERVMANIACDMALGSEEAVKMARNYHYELILMDIQMPVTDGVETSRKIRNFHEQVPIIAFTSLEPHEFDLEVFDQYLSKTNNGPAFYRSINKWVIDLEDDFSYLGKKEEYIETFKNKKVLLADDQQMNQMMTKKALENNGLIVTEAADGKELLELYQKSLDANGKSGFDLILTDINMPPFNGDEATRQIRKIEIQNKIGIQDEIPIIALSGDGKKEDIYRFLRCQMTDCFIKGNNPENLIKIIATYLAKETSEKKNKNIKNIKVQDITKAESLIIDKTTNQNSEVLDLDNISYFNKGDQEKILRLFLDESQTIINQVRKNNEEHNLKELSFLFHSLKGTSGNIGAKKLNNYVREIESYFGVGRLPNNQNWLGDLENIYSELKGKINQSLNDKL